MTRSSDLDEFIKEEFDDSHFVGNPGIEKTSIIDFARLESAERTIRGVTLNCQIIDIFKDATNIRNVLGDMDGYANEVSQNIRANVLIIASTLNKKPWRLIIDSLQRLPKEQAVTLAERTVQELNAFIAAARGGESIYAEADKKGSRD